MYIFCNYPVQVAAWSKACVCSHVSVEMAGSNPAGGINICLLCVLYVVRWRSLRWADHPLIGVLPSVVCRCLWSINLQNEEAITRIGPQHHRKKKMTQCKFSSHHVGLAAHNAVFIERVTLQIDMIWYICQLQLGKHPVAVVQYTFIHKQYIEQHK